MSTLTKEQLRERAREKIRSLEFSVTQTAFAYSRAELEEELELARIALASLEAEAVGTFRKGPCGYSSSFHEDAVPLYTAPPAPVSDEDKALAEQARAVIHCLDMCGVPSGDYADNKRLQLWGRVIEYGRHPAQVFVPTFDEWLEIRGNKPLGWVKDAMRESYDACRAAMLQGADGNSPVVPDGLRLALSNAGIAAPESDEMLAATCEKHIQALVTWVKDRKPFQPAAPQQEEVKP